jgi:hypothetical protein
MALIKPEQLRSGSYSISGSFSGSFYGDGSGLTNLPTQSFDTSSFVTTSSFNSFTSSYYTDSSSFSTRVTNLEDFSSSLDATFATDAELNAATASLSASISYLSSSFETFSGSYNTGSFTGSFIGDLTGTASYATSASYAISASYEINYETSSSYAETASIAESASYASTASYVTLSQTASYVQTAQTASYVNLAQTASYYNETDPVFTAKSGSLATTGSNIFNGNQTISGTLHQSGTFYPDQIDWFSSSIGYDTGSYILTTTVNGLTTYANYQDVATIINSGVVLTSSFNSYTSSNTSQFAGTSSYAQTASYVQNAQTASYVEFAQTASNILGGKATHVPYFITDTTLATSSIFQSGSTSIIINQDNNTTANPEALYVWQPHPTSINVVSGKGNLDNYLQLNIQNTNQGTDASSDIVATANNGNETTNYIDMGINSENYDAGFVGGVNDAYLYSTGRHLHIGNISNFPVQIFAGGSDVDIHNKLELNPNNQHLMSGSLDVSGSIKAFSFTGSLQGNATSATTSQTSSYSTTLGASLSQPANNQVRLLNSAGGTLSTVTVNNVTSASHADNASTADYATTAGNGGVTQLIAGSGITLIPAGGQGAVTVIASGGGGVTIISGSLVTGSFTNTTSYTFNHNLSTRTPIITVFDSNYNQIIPENIELVNTASAVITFPTAESGFAIGSTGGTTGTALSSSYALFSTYADTASYFAETDPVFVAKSASLATTGSNIFRGNQIVTGSLFTTGSNTLIGTTTLTGSLNITGSTTQTGNNTLIGTTTLTGSIQIAGDVTPQISSSFDLGSLTNPWRSIYVQSGSISIQSDIPGGIPAVISNANGNVTFAGAGFQLKSGSFVPFEISSSARTIIRVPDIPANDVGGLSIIGSSTGVYQGVTNAGGLLHLTSNDGQSSRITSDAYGINSVASYVGRKARGTAASPLPVQSGDTLTRISTIGWTGPEYGFLMSASSTVASTAIETVALENFTTSSFGTRHTFYNAPLGGTLRTLSAQIDTTGITIPSSSRFFGTASWAENALTASYVTTAQTASYVLNAISASYATTASYVKNAQTASYVNPLTQNVIITGSLQITGSGYINGLPILTSANTSSFLDGFGWYGVFCSTGSQTNPVANVSRSMQLDTTEHSNGVSFVSGSRITFAHAGVYNIQFSAQLEKTSNGTDTAYIWFKKNGTNVPRSNSNIDIAKAAGENGKIIAAWNYVDTFNINDYYEIVWQSSDTTVRLAAFTATGNIPSTPSVIITVTQVG